MVFFKPVLSCPCQKDVLNSQGRVADITQLWSAKLRAVVREWGFFVLFYYYYSDDMSELYYLFSQAAYQHGSQRSVNCCSRKKYPPELSVLEFLPGKRLGNAGGLLLQKFSQQLKITI